MLRKKTIKIVLLDGTPYGAKSAELSNWNCKVTIVPRASLKTLKELPEAGMPAVYFLLGEDDRVYIGETDALGERLAHHAITKEFWENLIAFTSPKLTKTEVKFLEHIFIKRLSEDGLASLQNSTTPKRPTIASEDEDAMEEFVDRAADVLLSLGYTLLGVSREVEVAAKESGLKVFCKGPNAEARGVFSQSGLLVLKGSSSRIQETNTLHEVYRKMRAQMVEGRVLKIQNDSSYIFTQDHLFSSPSTAAKVVLSRSANGLTEWKTKDGKAIKELEKKI